MLSCLASIDRVGHGRDSGLDIVYVNNSDVETKTLLIGALQTPAAMRDPYSLANSDIP